MRRATGRLQDDLVAKSDVLARVEADLARGHTYVAMRRLAGLTATYPGDLDLRARRAAIHRQVGNTVEAGRWGFLSEDVAHTEVAAFERACQSAWDRLRSLRLRTDPTSELGPLAGQRFTALIDQAAHEASAPVTWSEAGPSRPPARTSSSDTIPCLVAILIGLLPLPC